MSDINFEQKVYNLIKRIPKGKITSYKIIAQKLNSKAYRAVGNVCRKNPYAPIIPCHRVVKNNGKVGQYSRCVKKKIGLLRKEGILIKGNKIKNFQKVLFTF